MIPSVFYSLVDWLRNCNTSYQLTWWDESRKWDSQATGSCLELWKKSKIYMHETLSNSFLTVPIASMWSNEESKSIGKPIIQTNKIKEFAKRKRMPKIWGRNVEIAILVFYDVSGWELFGPIKGSKYWALLGQVNGPALAGWFTVKGVIKAFFKECKCVVISPVDSSCTKYIYIYIYNLEKLPLASTG